MGIWAQVWRAAELADSVEISLQGFCHQSVDGSRVLRVPSTGLPQQRKLALRKLSDAGHGFEYST